MAEVSLKELLESGAHFGHQTRRWNPKMGQFIYGARGGVHIIDLTQTAGQLQAACDFARQVTAGGGEILFVGTKRQAKVIIQAQAESASMPYVVERWLGGMLTNFRTIKLQVNRLKQLESQQESGEMAQNYNKKEQGVLAEEMTKLNHVFGGIKNMEQLPAAIYVVDAPREHISIAEAQKLMIPVIAIVDTNADPDLVDYAIAANDDAIKSIQVITGAIAAAAKAGKAEAEKASAKVKETGEEGGE